MGNEKTKFYGVDLEEIKEVAKSIPEIVDVSIGEYNYLLLSYKNSIDQTMTSRFTVNKDNKFMNIDIMAQFLKDVPHQFEELVRDKFTFVYEE